MMSSATLVLYVVDGSACAAAVARVERVLARYQGAVLLQVRNLSQVERTAEDRSIAVVPTLVMTHPVRSYLTGDLEPGEVVELLGRAGVRLPGTFEA